MCDSDNKHNSYPLGIKKVNQTSNNMTHITHSDINMIC